MLDDGNRPIQVYVVTYQTYRNTDRAHAKKQTTQEGLDSLLLDKIVKGDALVVTLLPENNNSYKLPFVLAQVDSDISNLDTTNKKYQFSSSDSSPHQHGIHIKQVCEVARR